jgi:transposase-like protein
LIILADKKELAGIQLLKRKINIVQVNQSLFLVQSQSDQTKWYEVTWQRNHWVCNCKDFKKHNKKCKHVYALDYYLGVTELASFSKNVNARPVCPKCNSNQYVIKRGFRYNRTGPEPIYYCKLDKHRFVNKTAFKYMRTKAKAIASALDLYFRGLSLRQVQEHLEDSYGIKVTHATIHNWLKKYVEIVNAFVEKNRPTTSERWHADETLLRVKGRHAVMWNLLDGETRYLLSQHISRRRDTKSAQRLLRKGMKLAKNKPKELVTDGLLSYAKAIEKELKSVEEGSQQKIIHLQGPLSEALNNKIERYQGTIKARLKTMNHFGNEATAKTFAKGFKTHYNFVKRHKALNGKTPAQAAKITKNKSTWLNLIKEASK